MFIVVIIPSSVDFIAIYTTGISDGTWTAY